MLEAVELGHCDSPTGEIAGLRAERWTDGGDPVIRDAIAIESDVSRISN
jgi:hypothetical protein